MERYCCEGGAWPPNLSRERQDDLPSVPVIAGHYKTHWVNESMRMDGIIANWN